jgi:DNA-binding transcriptional ArsR family regulator
MTISTLAAVVDIGRALGHPARLRVLAMLRSGELCVCQMTEVLGLAQSTVSTHVRELKRAGLVTERKDGRWVHLALTSAPELSSWIDAALGSLANAPELEHDEQLLAEVRQLPLEDLCRLGYEGAKATVGSGSAAGE